MPLFGKDGIIEFRRELPSPVVLPASALDKPNKTILVNSDAFWPCEPVILVGSVNGLQSTVNGFYSKDSLDKATIHTTIQGAANNDPATRISLTAFQQKPTVLLLNNHSCQTLEVLKFYNSIVLASNYSGTEEVTLADWPEREDAYYAAGPRFADWRIVASMRGWNLSTSAPAVDVSAIGNKFSEAVKSVVSGSGSLDFIIDLFGSATEYSPDNLLRIALMTERGAMGNARFYLSQGVGGDDDPCKGKVNGRSPLSMAVYYNANILFTDAAVDMSADGLAQGSADFVTTGPIRLGAETDKPQVYSCEQDAGAYDFWVYANSVGLSYNTNAYASTYYSPDRNLYSYYADRPTGSFSFTGHFLSKFDQANAPVWTRNFNASDQSDFFSNPTGYGQPMTVDKDGFIWIAFRRLFVSSTQSVKTYVAKIDPNSGAVLDSFCFAIDVNITSANSSWGVIQAITIDDDYNIYLGFGLPQSETYWNRLVVMKVSSTGSFIWSKFFRVFRVYTVSDGIAQLLIKDNVLYVICKRFMIQKMGLDGSLLSPMTFLGVQNSMSSSSLNASSLSDDNYTAAFDSNGFLYLSVSWSGMVVKMTNTLQPVWAYYFTYTSPSSGSTVEISGRNVIIDNSDRIFLSATTSFIEVTTDGAFVNGRTIFNCGVYSDRAFDFAMQKQGDVDDEFIPIRNNNNNGALLYGLLAKSGQVGTWAGQSRTLVIAQPAYERSYNMNFVITGQQYNAWTPIDLNHQLLTDTVVGTAVTNYIVSQKSQTGVIAV